MKVIIILSISLTLSVSILAGASQLLTTADQVQKAMVYQQLAKI